MREEIPGTSPAAGGVTPDHPVREKGRESPPYVFVLDKHGYPLQPCTSARARQLLKRGRAVVHRHTPFVIRLKDRTTAESEIDGVGLGVDPGSRHTGIAVFTARAGQRRARYGIQLDHRGASILRKMQQRAAYRRARRVRKLRYRMPRFSNRGRRQEWLPPSLRHRVVTTVSRVDRLARWAPVRAVHLERVAFDTHAISAGRPLECVEYQHGTLHGTEVREYLLTKWNRTRSRLPKPTPSMPWPSANSTPSLKSCPRCWSWDAPVVVLTPAPAPTSTVSPASASPGTRRFSATPPATW
ncbi:RNA-guided endonuclease IscB [Nonomuraea sp. NPDC003201]